MATAKLTTKHLAELFENVGKMALGLSYHGALDPSDEDRSNFHVVTQFVTNPQNADKLNAVLRRLSFNAVQTQAMQRLADKVALRKSRIAALVLSKSNQIGLGHSEAKLMVHDRRGLDLNFHYEQRDFFHQKIQRWEESLAAFLVAIAAPNEVLSHGLHAAMSRQLGSDLVFTNCDGFIEAQGGGKTYVGISTTSIGLATMSLKLIQRRVNNGAYGYAICKAPGAQGMAADAPAHVAALSLITNMPVAEYAQSHARIQLGTYGGNRPMMTLQDASAQRRRSVDALALGIFEFISVLEGPAVDMACVESMGLLMADAYPLAMECAWMDTRPKALKDGAKVIAEGLMKVQSYLLKANNRMHARMMPMSARAESFKSKHAFLNGGA